MSAFSSRGLRMMKAVEQYKSNYKRWDTSQIFSRVTIKSTGEGQIKGSFEVKEDICNLAKSLHGGFTASVIDSMSFLGVTTHDKARLCYTTDMNVVFIGRAYPGDIIDFEGKAIYVTKTRATMDFILTERKKGWIIAKAVLGFIFPDPPYLDMEVFPYNPAEL